VIFTILSAGVYGERRAVARTRVNASSCAGACVRDDVNGACVCVCV